MCNLYQSEAYPEELRLIRIYDKEEDRIIEFLTNNLQLAASTIAKLYKGRWEIETFFKWMKQNLKIKTFVGTSENAVMTQLWVAMILYVLLSFIKFQTKYGFPLLELLRIVREVLWETKSILELLRVNFDEICKGRSIPEQLAFY